MENFIFCAVFCPTRFCKKKLKISKKPAFVLMSALINLTWKFIETSILSLQNHNTTIRKVLNLKNNLKLKLLRFWFRSCFYKNSSKLLEICWRQQKITDNRKCFSRFFKTVFDGLYMYQFWCLQHISIKCYSRGCNFAPLCTPHLKTSPKNPTQKLG